MRKVSHHIAIWDDRYWVFTTCGRVFSKDRYRKAGPTGRMGWDVFGPPSFWWKLVDADLRCKNCERVLTARGVTQ